MNTNREREKLQHEHNGRKLIHHCETHGAQGRWGKGDHRVECYRGSSMVIPAKTLGTGLQRKIVAWIISVGLAVLAMAVLAEAIVH